MPSWGRNLRTVTTFVREHTFRASCKVGFKLHMSAGLTLTQSTMLPSTQLKWKQNFPAVTKPSLMNLYLTQEHQNSCSSIILNTNCYKLLPAEKLVFICRSNNKHQPSNGVACGQDKCNIRKCFTYWGGDRKKYNGHHRFLIQINNFKKHVVTPSFYVVKWKGQTYSTHD